MKDSVKFEIMMILWCRSWFCDTHGAANRPIEISSQSKPHAFSENRILIASILSWTGSFSIRLSLEPTHPSRFIPWISEISREIDDRSYRFAEIQIWDFVLYRIRKYFNFWARIALYRLDYSHRGLNILKILTVIVINIIQLSSYKLPIWGKFCRGTEAKLPRFCLKLPMGIGWSCACVDAN